MGRGGACTAVAGVPQVLMGTSGTAARSVGRHMWPHAVAAIWDASRLSRRGVNRVLPEAASHLAGATTLALEKPRAMQRTQLDLHRRRGLWWHRRPEPHASQPARELLHSLTLVGSSADPEQCNGGRCSTGTSCTGHSHTCANTSCGESASQHEQWRRRWRRGPCGCCRHARCLLSHGDPQHCRCIAQAGTPFPCGQQ